MCACVIHRLIVPWVCHLLLPVPRCLRLLCVPCPLIVLGISSFILSPLVLILWYVDVRISCQRMSYWISGASLQTERSPFWSPSSGNLLYCQQWFSDLASVCVSVRCNVLYFTRNSILATLWSSRILCGGSGLVDTWGNAGLDTVHAVSVCLMLMCRVLLWWELRFCWVINMKLLLMSMDSIYCWMSLLAPTHWRWGANIWMVFMAVALITLGKCRRNAFWSKRSVYFSHLSILTTCFT